jgi:hypothetical protein
MMEAGQAGPTNHHPQRGKCQRGVMLGRALLGFWDAGTYPQFSMARSIIRRRLGVTRVSSADGEFLVSSW